MLFFLIPVGILVLAMVVFAFWPRPPRHVVDINDLEHPPGPQDGEPS